MFALPWVELCWPKTPIEPGACVAVLIRALGLWSLNPARIVYVVDEAGPPARYGFAYGTLPGHAEKGEERFLVEHHDDGAVVYDLRAFSRPGHPLTALGYPYARRLQERFALGSLAAMGRAVEAGAR